MATYGPYTPAGFIPFSGFSPTLGQNDAITPVTNGSAQFDGMTQGDNQLSRSLYQGPNRLLRRLLITLLGVAPGATATENRSRVQAVQSMFGPTDNGGLVPIETVAVINRATTATDVVNTVDSITRSYAPSAYPVDVSGNGGGGHLGF